MRRRFAPYTGTALALVLLAVCGAGRSASAGQLGALLSPGPLARAHATLEGGTRCQQCHEAGRQVTAAKCLTCHQPIAARLSRPVGVHRNATDCVSCHTEHVGANADLRHLDTRTFNHAAQTGFALNGVHAKVAGTCVSCHKGRSFLDAKPTCASCHRDPHGGALGSDCVRCHTTRAPFAAARAQFDHAKARFPLTGAHRIVECQQCHRTAVFRDAGLSRAGEPGTCATCHRDPHERRFGTTCASCHTTDRWTSRSVDHARTRFPLVGAHAAVTCEKCHGTSPATQTLRFDTCAACHTDVHKGSMPGDCRTCHDERSFRGAAIDHTAKTGFALDGKHQGLTCVRCHTGLSGPDVPLARKSVDYRGASPACVSCHESVDPHKGAFGRSCDACHRPATFAVAGFRHPREPAFFAGRHSDLRCVQCHAPVTSTTPPPATSPSMTCVSCHADVHLGQVGLTCERCHDVTHTTLSRPAVAHERSRFQLTGAHAATQCVLCHRKETGVFPAGAGTAVRLTPVDTTCATCHKDPHLGQLDVQCETCHQTAAFTIPAFTHRGMDDFFGGFHGRLACQACHKTETGTFPAGRGTSVRFRVGRTCDACHRGF